jgi:hypothetical protein
MLEESRSLKNTKDTPCLRALATTDYSTSRPERRRNPDSGVGTDRAMDPHYLLAFCVSGHITTLTLPLTTITLQHEHDFNERSVRSEISLLSSSPLMGFACDKTRTTEK